MKEKHICTNCKHYKRNKKTKKCKMGLRGRKKYQCINHEKKEETK